MARETPQHLQGPGLTCLLDTQDFGCWESAIAQTLGHHRSSLRGPANSFNARLHCAQLEQLQVLHLKGQGSLELIREQCDHAVLWLPLQGTTEETINGTTWLAEPGTALLFRPGDAMRGLTSPTLEGISLVIPADQLPPEAAAATPLIEAGAAQQALLKAARAAAKAAATKPVGAAWAANAFTNALQLWANACSPEHGRERITSTRRRQSVARAREWMEAHLHQPFTVVDLAVELNLSVRQLQYNFLAELGRAPMAEAKRLRLHRLRSLLRSDEQRARSIASLMEASGLLASGATAASYNRWFGEKPRTTRRHALNAPDGPS